VELRVLSRTEKNSDQLNIVVCGPGSWRVPGEKGRTVIKYKPNGTWIARILCSPQ